MKYVKLVKGRDYRRDVLVFQYGIWTSVEDNVAKYLQSTGCFEIAPVAGKDLPDISGKVSDGVIGMVGEGKDAVPGVVKKGKEERKDEIFKGKEIKEKEKSLEEKKETLPPSKDISKMTYYQRKRMGLVKEKKAKNKK